MYGGQLLPLFLENLPGFPTMEAGLYLMPRGIATFVSMSLVGRFSGRFSARSMICAGMLLSLAGTYEMIRLTPQAPGSVILLPMILLGLGLGLICIPLSSLAFATIPGRLAPEVAGLYSLVRSVGSSIGISLASTCLNHSAKVNWAGLRGYVDPYHPAVRRRACGPMPPGWRGCRGWCSSRRWCRPSSLPSG